MGSSLKKRCTQKVIATCTDKRRVYEDDNTPSYYPVYEFDYNGNHYKVSKDQNVYKPEIGTEHEIYINPDNPEEYYHPKADAAQNGFAMIFVIAFGAAFLFFGYYFLMDLFR